MNDSNATLAAGYFDRLYAASDDPWHFATSEYELAKYRATVAALPRERYCSLLEVGCSIGVLTRMLTARADRVLAVDVAHAALRSARERCADLTNVEFAPSELPHRMPEGAFDGVVLSEVGYYWSRNDLAAALDAFADRLEPGAEIVAVHFTPDVDEYPRTGDDVHEQLLADERFAGVHADRKERYRLDVLRRR